MNSSTLSYKHIYIYEVPPAYEKDVPIIISSRLKRNGLSLKTTRRQKKYQYILYTIFSSENRRQSSSWHLSSTTEVYNISWVLTRTKSVDKIFPDIKEYIFILNTLTGESPYYKNVFCWKCRRFKISTF